MGALDAIKPVSQWTPEDYYNAAVAQGYSQSENEQGGMTWYGPGPDGEITRWRPGEDSGATTPGDPFQYYNQQLEKAGYALGGPQLQQWAAKLGLPLDQAAQAIFGPGSQLINDPVHGQVVKAGTFDPNQVNNGWHLPDMEDHGFLSNYSGALMMLPAIAGIAGLGAGAASATGGALEGAGAAGGALEGAGAAGAAATGGGGASVDMLGSFLGDAPSWLSGGGSGLGEFGSFDLAGNGALGGLDWGGFGLDSAAPFMSAEGTINPAWFGADAGSGVLSGFGDLWNTINSPIGKLLGGAAAGGGGLGGLLGGTSPLNALLTYLAIQDQKSIDRTPSTSQSSTSVTHSPFITQAAQNLINTGNQVGTLNPSTYQPYYDKASGYLDKAAGGIPSVDLNAYMNPYLDSILAPMKQEHDIQTGQRLNQIDSQAAMHNAFGTGRADILKSYNQGEADRTWAGTESGIRGNAFNTALGTATNDLNRQASVGGQYGNLGTQSGSLAMQGALLPITAQSAALRTALPAADTTTTSNASALGRPNSSFATGLGTLATLNKLNGLG